ncbi:cache domain methyl-accepting chemotaxis signaling domain multi-domain-containing protein [Babesia ovata]|uniref:Cache domain methyl-accepting chemotaxis signaling domain multi-domain-containing protein n=1 Tax=Babesia ovata TaxID=189622 RepID=A0A2H6KEG5_9APIC|nr:cache domain methyl-accepting chemotaxis signaling domain multi-domain-containing protein [Babesia ovata]GBE61377.1 cache domain methyl-accepting chemotaxis signaling domain multi-domain-containing protein [Babesia ovata]
MTHENVHKRTFSKDNLKSAATVAGGYLLFSVAVWSVFANPRRHEWVDVLMDYCNHRRSQYSGIWAKFSRKR